MKITVFGGSGFLGSHVADELTDRGHKVLVFDKSPTSHLKDSQTMMVADVLDEDAVGRAAEGAEVVYNFIALSDIDDAKNVPLESIRVNVLGNANILEACRRAKVGRFVFSSSIYVYSDSGSFYRSTKQASELFIEDYKNAYGLDYTILRYGSLYGPRATQKNWIYKILTQALKERKITRLGDGEEIREYIHVRDAARLSVDILDETYRNKRIIISGNEQLKIKDLLVMIKEILKGQVEVEYLEAKSSEHYEITPYVFNPQVAMKIRSAQYVDMGQGILEILSDMYRAQRMEEEAISL